MTRQCETTPKSTEIRLFAFAAGWRHSRDLGSKCLFLGALVIGCIGCHQRCEPASDTANLNTDEPANVLAWDVIRPKTTMQEAARKLRLGMTREELWEDVGAGLSDGIGDNRIYCLTNGLLTTRFSNNSLVHWCIHTRTNVVAESEWLLDSPP